MTNLISKMSKWFHWSGERDKYILLL